MNLSLKARRRAYSPHAGIRRQTGFSLIEVLIALVVLAVGLLGLALLQTTNLRYTQSAQQRTMAVNLASELLDTIRTNRSQIASYEMAEADFAGVAPDPETGCATFPITSNANNIERWQCEVRESLGPDAFAIVVVNDPEVSVNIVWSEENMAELAGEGEIELVTTL
ncbi:MULTISPECIES: type IV pilus modification protein PilV [Luteimonas]|uniref:type IV pilus modification protein PilV n=1 Tax=Luteimonas TaxID=83614 RepID=UPI000C7D1325|nr:MULTISPECIES: type IV pilus modification protein PilV [Luteimonas]